MATITEYESAATQLHPNKQGVNRILWNDNGSADRAKWTMISKEYLPFDPRQVSNPFIVQLRNSTTEELEVIRQILGIR